MKLSRLTRAKLDPIEVKYKDAVDRFIKSLDEAAEYLKSMNNYMYDTQESRSEISQSFREYCTLFTQVYAGASQFKLENLTHPENG